jgi:hypothetical protein
VGGTLDSTVHTGQSGKLYPRSPQHFPESGLFAEAPAWASDSSVHHRLVQVQCTPDSSVHHGLMQVWLALAKLLQFNFSHFEKVPST